MRISMPSRSESQLIAWIRKTRGAVSHADRELVGHTARHAGITRALADLRRFGVPTRLDFRWSADGSGVIEDEPRTVHIHRRMLAADRAPATVLALSHRTAAIDMASVIRHEIGHALFFLDPRVARTVRFTRLFGDPRRSYRVGAVADEVERRFTRHGGLANPRYRRAISLYAATHPYEAFAEAVRIALTTAGDDAAIAAWVGDRALAPIVEDQIQFAAAWLRSYKTV
jgi:hypothetical protein